MKNKITPFIDLHQWSISRLILAILLLSTFIKTAWADPYILVMSKNDTLCESMLHLYNEDMGTYGRINYGAHDIFSRIEWHNIDHINEPLVTPALQANFDINNDGKNELVIKQTWTRNYILEESLYIFPADSPVLSKLKPGQNGLAALFETPNMMFSYKNIIYYLKDVPNFLHEQISAYKLKHLPDYLKNTNINDLRRDFSKEYIAGSFVLQPFIWHGTTYISMTNRNPEWIVIGKYIQAEEMQDICYFYDESHRFVNY